MPKLTNQKKLNEWLELYLGNFNARLGDFLMREICQQDRHGCWHRYFSTTIAGKKFKFITSRKKHNTQEELLVGRLNEALNTTNMERSSYYNVDQFNEMFGTYLMASILNTWIFHLFHIILTNLKHLTTLKVKFDILGITKNRLKTGKQPINNIDHQGYVVESSTPTDASCGGALLYINKKINNKLRKDFAKNPQK